MSLFRDHALRARQRFSLPFLSRPPLASLLPTVANDAIHWARNAQIYETISQNVPAMPDFRRVLPHGQLASHVRKVQTEKNEEKERPHSGPPPHRNLPHHTTPHIATPHHAISDNLLAGKELFSFSASGWLIPFHLGVMAGLQECGRLDREKAFLLGASGGAFAVASYVSGVEPERMHEIVKEVAWTVNKNGILGKVRGPLMEAFQKYLPADAFERCSGRIGVALTRTWPNPSLEAEFVTSFTSKEDLIEAVMASGYIPFYISPQPVMRYRSGFYVDGGASSLQPSLAGRDAINVFSFPSSAVTFGPLGHQIEHDIGLDQQHADVTFSGYDFNKWTLIPPEEPTLDWLYELGKSAALRWVKHHQWTGPPRSAEAPALSEVGAAV